MPLVQSSTGCSLHTLASNLYGSLTLKFLRLSPSGPQRPLSTRRSLPAARDSIPRLIMPTSNIMHHPITTVHL